MLNDQLMMFCLLKKVSEVVKVVWIDIGISHFVIWEVVVEWSIYVVLLKETGVSKVVEDFKIKIGVSPFLMWEVVVNSSTNVVLLSETEVSKVVEDVWIKTGDFLLL